MLMRATNATHPNVQIIYGDEFLPERKEPHVLYLTATQPGKPFAVACQLTPERLSVLREFVSDGNRVIGYNAVRRNAVGV